eukprot:1139877-Pelagomonas_calceolata.AAC.3
MKWQNGGWETFAGPLTLKPFSLAYNTNDGIIYFAAPPLKESTHHDQMWNIFGDPDEEEITQATHAKMKYKANRCRQQQFVIIHPNS